MHLVQLYVACLLFVTSYATECHMESKAWTLLQFHLDPKVEQKTHTQIVLDQDGLNKLQSLADTPLSIVSIIGVYRSGKSTLLNRLLPPLAPADVFKVGHTVQAQTEEVTIYPVPPCALQGMKESIQQSISQSNTDAHELGVLLSVLSNVPTNTTLVLCDGPGLGAPNRAQLFDAQLLAIVNLMSSVVLYNSPGVIQRHEVIQLSEAVDAAFALSLFDASSTSPDVVIDRPHAIWCMQNLQVELLDRDQKPMSGKAYVQHVLNQIDASSTNTNYSAKLNHFFASIDSVVLPPPTESFKGLKRNNELTLDQLTPEYRVARAQLFARILALLRPKRLGATVLNGATLSELLNQWITNINVPTDHKQTSTSELLNNILQREVIRVMGKYQSEMNAKTLPMSDQQLRQAHEQTVASIKQAMPNDSQMSELSSRFSRAAETEYVKYVEKNVGAIGSNLQSQAAAAEQSWKQQLSKLQSGTPSSAQIIQAESTILEQWRTSSRSMQNADASAVAQYEASLMNVMKADSQPLLSQAITNEKDQLAKHCEARFKSLQLPVDEHAINQIGKECLAEWMSSQPSLNALDDERKSSLSVSFQSAIDSFVQAANVKNDESLLEQCAQGIRKRGAELVHDSNNWMNDSRFQSRTALKSQVATLISNQNACKEAVVTSRTVQTELVAITDQLNTSLETRIWITRALDFIVFAFALVDIFLAKHLIAEMSRNSSGKNYMLLNGNVPQRSLSKRSQLIAVIGCLIGAPLYALSHAVPDALPRLAGIALNLAILLLLIVGVIVICQLVFKSVRGKQDKYVR